MEKSIKSSWDMKIISSEVTKHRTGEASTFNRDLFKTYFFIATVTFETGSVVRWNLTDAREEFSAIESIKLNIDDLQSARKKAFEEYNRVYEVISSDKFAYSRAKDGYCNLYGRDSESPTGISLLSGCTSYKLADTISQLLGKSGSLSPTENLCTAR